MSVVQDIKAAIGEYNPVASGAPGSCCAGYLLPRLDFMLNVFKKGHN
jgi:hypothetical protein